MIMTTEEIIGTAKLQRMTMMMGTISVATAIKNENGDDDDEDDDDDMFGDPVDFNPGISAKDSSTKDKYSAGKQQSDVYEDDKDE